MTTCFIDSDNHQTLSAKDAAAWMDKQNIGYKTLKCFNWVANYNSAPIAKVRISRTKDALVIDYHVAEYSTCGMETVDGSEVYKDTCMECFIKAPEDSGYYNIECNCIGTLYIGYRKPGEDKEILDANTLISIDRFASLGPAPFDTTLGYKEWTLSIVISFKHLPYLNDNGCRTDYLGNIYKYGKRLHKVYYVSLFPISTETIGFHRPEFFQPILK